MSNELSRGTLYADLPLIVLSTMSMGDPQSPLWSAFQLPGEHMRSKDRGLAMDELQNLATNPNSPSQVRLLAWRWLRDLGVHPDAGIADRVMAVVIEDAELYALYADGSACLMLAGGNLKEVSGNQEIANRAAPAIDAASQLVGGFPSISQKPMPTPGVSRITFLTPGGIRSRPLTADDSAPGQPLAEILGYAKQVRDLLKT